jgi:hypothetical protein
VPPAHVIHLIEHSQVEVPWLVLLRGFGSGSGRAFDAYVLGGATGRRRRSIADQERA